MRSSARFHILLVTILILLAAATADAQVGNRLGFFGGLNLAGQGGDMEDAAEFTAMALESELGGSWSSSMVRNPGLAFGGFYIIQTSPTFAWQIEGQYIQRGSRMELEGTGVGGFMGTMSLDSDFELNYLEVPLLARFTPNSSGSVRPIFLAGPVIGFTTSAKLRVHGEGESDSQSISSMCVDTTIGMLGGIGLTMPIGDANFLTVQARYYIGLTEPFEDDTEAKSGDIGFFAGVEFPVGR